MKKTPFLSGGKMKKLMQVCLISASLILAGSSGFAKNNKTNGNEELPNGRPFQILQEQIDENSAAIEANAVAISDLQETAVQLQNQIDDINIDISELEQKVQTNADAISVLNDQMVAVQNDLDLSQREIEAIKADVLQVKATHQADVDLLTAQIEAQQDEIDALQQQVNAAVANLSGQLASLQAAVDTNSGEISGLLTQVTALMAQIITMNATLDNHETRLGALESSVSGINAQIASINQAIANLETRLAAVEKEVFPGTLITGQGEAYGHHGACSGWNGCGSAANCALWACEVNGYSEVVSFGEDKPCNQFDNCHLFYSRGHIDWNWGNWCGVSGVTEIVCK